LISEGTVFQFTGTYESGIASYKHLYFNATTNSLKIWILIVVGIVAFYECLKMLMKLIVVDKVRYSMVLLFLLSIFSHYYAWWAYVNYYNDEFYNQWNHQMFFTVSNVTPLHDPYEAFPFDLNTINLNYLDHWTHINRFRATLGEQGQFSDTQKNTEHSRHCHFTHFCERCRPIHIKCF